MANATSGNVIYVDTTAAFTQVGIICAVKYIGASSGTAAITSTTGAVVLWQDGGTNNLPAETVEIKVDSGFTVTVTNSAKLIIYLEAD